VLGLDVAVFSKVGDELIVGDAAGLGWAIHAAAYFAVDVAVVNEVCEVVELKDVLRDVLDPDAHVLVAIHGGA
jgi:hypothetical protein